MKSRLFNRYDYADGMVSVGIAAQMSCADCAKYMRNPIPAYKICQWRAGAREFRLCKVHAQHQVPQGHGETPNFSLCGSDCTDKKRIYKPCKEI